MQVKALGHVVLKVRDLHRSVPFYAQVLGLKEVAQMGDRMVFFSIAGNHHDLALVQMGADAPSAPEQSPGLAHVAFKVGDSLDELRAMKDWLETQGVKPDRIVDHIVSKSIYFHDPDGNQIEVFVDSDPRIWREDPTKVASRLPLAL
jgi:catechol 2,3-dioxygenase